MPLDVVVVGSLNQDLTLRVPHLPGPGETVLGHGRRSGGGGKGANQAMAAVRLGAAVAMVGKVGDDPEGDALVAALTGAGVDISRVLVDVEEPTGMAVITVDDEAENAIVVLPGANSRLTPSDVARARPLLEEAAVVLAQLEIPLETVMATARSSDRFVLNPAPARDLDHSIWEQVHVLVPNRSELARLAQVDIPQTLLEVERAVARLPGRPAVVVTLGAEGALVVEEGRSVHVPAIPVEPVDTTGAGDAFCGALAAALSRGASLVEATGRAVAAGAIATTRLGAQEAMPTSEEVEAILAAH